MHSVSIEGYGGKREYRIGWAKREKGREGREEEGRGWLAGLGRGGGKGDGEREGAYGVTLHVFHTHYLYSGL